MDQQFQRPDYSSSARISPIRGSRVTTPLPELQPQPLYAPATIQPQRQSRGGVPGLLLASLLVLGMVLGGAGVGGAWLLVGNRAVAPLSNNAPVAVVPTATSPDASDKVAQVQPNSIGNIYKKLSPSIVQIVSTLGNNGEFGGGGEGSGTGIVVDKQGYILTNNHVIDGATSVRVDLLDGSEYPATVIGTAPQDDLAIIQAKLPADKLVPAELGDSSTVQVGDAVIAIGYPFGFAQSVTSGIVSGINRDYAETGNRTMRGLIQVDAAINPGNSGGPLLNDQGQIIAINTLIESPVQAFTGIGLSIPINTAKGLLPQLEQGGKVQRPWLGISGIEITPSLKQDNNLPVDKGVVVAELVKGGPGEAAGLQPAEISQTDGTISKLGDIITTIDGQSVGSVADLTGYLDGKKPGDKVTLGVIRNGKNINVDVTLQPWPDTPVQDNSTPGTPSDPNNPFNPSDPNSH